MGSDSDGYAKAIEQRQVLRACPTDVLRGATGDPRADGTAVEVVYFTQHLLPMYINEHPECELIGGLSTTRADGFSNRTPRRQIPLGTLEVDNYLRAIRKHKVEAFDFH